METKNQQLEKLFQPITLGNLKLANRIAMAPMTRAFSPHGVPGDDVVKYYGRRAAADIGLIITEGTVVGHKAANGQNGVPHFYGDKALQGWQRVADEVHKMGGKIVPQLWHVGNTRQLGVEPDPTVPGYGPMAVEKNGEVQTIGMTKNDIDEVIAAFAHAARNAKKLGFDGVEIHGAHGYLIDQFLWEKSNQRTDQYGGNLANRTRFAVEIVRAVRAAVGADFPIIFRFSQWKQQDYSAKLAASPELLAQLLEMLTAAGVDIFHASTRRFWLPEFENSTLNLAGWTKKLTNKPVITVGSVGLDQDFITTFSSSGSQVANPASLDKLVAPLTNDEFDLVAVGRALIADPSWATKVKENRFQDLVAYSDQCLKTLF